MGWDNDLEEFQVQFNGEKSLGGWGKRFGNKKFPVFLHHSQSQQLLKLYTRKRKKSIKTEIFMRFSAAVDEEIYKSFGGGKRVNK